MARFLRACRARYRTMGTLTYPGEGEEWREAKRHFRALVERLRRDGPIDLFWFIEWQRRGVPHFHFFASRYIDKEWLAVSWSDIVSGGDWRHLAAGTRIEALKRGRAGTVSYAKKYARKQEQKELPPLLEDSGFGRWWGVVGDRSIVCASTAATADEMGSRAVQAAFWRLFDKVEGLLSADRLRVIHEGACYAYWCCDDEAEGLLRAAILALEEELTRCRSSAATNPTAASRGYSG